jgi:choline kinase
MTVGIIIAAGRGARMGSLTEDLPKCMLPVGGRPLLHHTIGRLREAGCAEIVVVVGYKSENILAPDCAIVKNPKYASNNVLHSLMCARDYFSGDMVCSYSDIWLEPEVLEKLCQTPGDFVAAVDVDWEAYYEDRSDHPLSEAENVFFDEEKVIRRIGKHLTPEEAGKFSCGEFLGLWRMSKTGAGKFVNLFDELDVALTPLSPFQNAAEWQTAYITDIFQELIDRGERISSSLTRRQWAELDTRQDIERLQQIAGRQNLRILSN